MIETPLGTEFRLGPCRIFFGNKNSQILTLKNAEPRLKFLRLKQIHSALIHDVDASTPDYQIEGDALITKEAGLALCSITADCVPVLVFCAESRMISAIHSGWRGVAARLVPLTLERMKEKGANPNHMHIWMGPHILKKSFEVERDVCEKILASASLSLESPAEDFNIKENGRYNIDLAKILLRQISEFSISSSQIQLLARDTKTDLSYHSARRDRELSGRQISWISLSSAPTF